MKNRFNLTLYSAANFIKRSMLFCYLILLIKPSFAKVNHEVSKTFTKEFAIHENHTLQLEHRRGNIEVAYYDGTQAKVEVKVTIRGDIKEDLELVLDKYTLEAETSGNKITLNSTFNILQWSSSSGGVFSRAKYRLRFKDDFEINSRVSDIKANLKLWIPKIHQLNLSNKHNDIYLSDLPCAVKVSLFSGDLKAGAISGDLKFEYQAWGRTIG